MDFTDLQMFLTVVVVLTAAAVVVFFDHRKRQRRQQQLQRVRARSAVRPHRSTRLFDIAPLEYAPAKRLATERPLQPQVATTTVSKRPPTPPPMERETVTVQVAPSHAGGPSFSNEIQLPAFTIDAILWERLIASQPKHNMIASAETEAEPASKPQTSQTKPQTSQTMTASTPHTNGSANVVDAAYNVVRDAPQSALPTGMIQQATLQQLMESEERFTGLVVAIGINDSDSSMWHSQGLMQSVGTYIAGLLHKNDFSCRTGYDEFVMVCAGEQGAEAQRRLNHVSERLWDYQLRGIGACSILFSWGGVQVQDQPLAEAITSATERMRETKRSGPSTALANAYREAV